MKKKTVAIIAAVALVALAVPAFAFANVMPGPWSAANTSATVQPVLTAQATNGVAGAVGCFGYADADNNGICDNCESGTCPTPNNACPAPGSACAGYVDANGDGVCDNCSADRSACPGYTDVDNNGICDNRGSGAWGQGQGYGQGYGHGHGHGGGHGRGCMRG